MGPTSKRSNQALGSTLSKRPHRRLIRAKKRSRQALQAIRRFSTGSSQATIKSACPLLALPNGSPTKRPSCSPAGSNPERLITSTGPTSRSLNGRPLPSVTSTQAIQLSASTASMPTWLPTKRPTCKLGRPTPSTVIFLLTCLRKGSYPLDKPIAPPCFDVLRSI